MDSSKVSQKTEKIKGVIPPVITTFDNHGEFDPRRMEDFILFLKPKVMGLFVCGTYGSGPLMNESERKQVLETVMKVVGSSVPAIHTLLEFRGIDAGYPRHPYSEVPACVREKMKNAVNKLRLSL